MPASQINTMRKNALLELLNIRSAFSEHYYNDTQETIVQNFINLPRSNNIDNADKKLIVQFNNINQIPAEWLEDNSNLEYKNPLPHGIIIPIEQYNLIPLHLRHISWLALPRFCALAQQELDLKQKVHHIFNFSDTERFAGCFVQNIAHINICKNINMMSGFGFNATNALSVASYAAMGVSTITVSVEATCEDIQYCMPSEHMISYASEALKTNNKNTQPQLAAIIYGHMPLMMTYACPLHNKKTCAECNGQGTLLDRKGEKLNVTCTSSGKTGVRIVHNAVPIYMADKKNTLNVNTLIAMFTNETQEEVMQILNKIKNSQPNEERYTRGLYFK